MMTRQPLCLVSYRKVSNKQLCVEAVKKVAEANGGEIHYLVNSAVYFGSKALDVEKEDRDKTFFY